MPAGRPTDYDDGLPEVVFKLSLLGMTDKEIAKHLGIALSTMSNWKLEHPEFMDALKNGKGDADSKVADSLYKQAMNGNVTACIFWLKNRRIPDWRDKHEIAVDAASAPFERYLESINGKNAESETDGD